MDTLVYISAAALVFVIIMVFVNARRVSDLRSEVENIPEPEGYTYRDSSILSFSGGSHLPKKYYWVRIKNVGAEKETAEKNAYVAEITLDTASTNTDTKELYDDVVRDRIRAIYRPEDNHYMSFKAVAVGGVPKLYISRSITSPKFFEQIPTNRNCAIVGIPEVYMGTNS